MKKLTVSGDKTCCCKWIMRVIDSDPFFLSCHSSSSLQDQSQEVTWCPGERCQLKSITHIEKPCFMSCLFLLWSACLVPDFSQSLWKTWHRMTWETWFPCRARKMRGSPTLWIFSVKHDTLTSSLPGNINVFYMLCEQDTKYWLKEQLLKDHNQKKYPNDVTLQTKWFYSLLESESHAEILSTSFFSFCRSKRLVPLILPVCLWFLLLFSSRE